MDTFQNQIHVLPHVPLISKKDRDLLVSEIREIGPHLVHQKRTNKAKKLREEGDIEGWQEAQREAEYIKQIFFA